MGSLNETGLPVFVSGCEANFFQGETPGVSLVLISVAFLKSDMNVHDFKLQVIDYFFSESGHHSVLFFLLSHFFERRLQNLPDLFEYFILFSPDSRKSFSASFLKLDNNKYVIEHALDRYAGYF